MKANNDQAGEAKRSRRAPALLGLIGVGTGVLALLAGCAAGPNYHPPQPKVATSFAQGTQTNLTAAEPVADWWRGFNDPELNQLIERALTNNHDLRIATARLREARALRRSNQYDLLPTLAAEAGYVKQVSSKDASFGFPRALREFELYDTGFDATWELDLFGHVRRSVEAASAELQGAEAGWRDVAVSLISEVARNYFELRGVQNELSVAHRNADNQRETVKITQARLDGGRGTELDVARAQALLSATLAGIPPLETAIARSAHRLGVLTGQQPGAWTEELQKPVALPSMPPMIAVGDPASLLRRRPDLRAAERELAAATARIGVSTADLFPRLTFSGHLGLQASSVSDLGRSGADTWSFGPHLSWAALDLGHVRARIRAAGARADAALARYERTVLTTLEETENALVDFGRAQARRDYLQDSVKASALASSLARQRFDNGATDFLTVLDAERVLLEAEDQLAQSQTRTATALVALYKSLGGGWDTPPAQQAAETARH